MRIGVDGGCWANERGYGRHARELLGAMARQAPSDQLVFFLDEASRSRFRLAGPNVQVVRVPQSRPPSEAAAAEGSRSVLDMLRFTRAVSKESLDVLLFPSVYTFFPVPPGLRAVVGIHDAIAERFPARTLPSLRARLFWTAKVRLAVAQAMLVLTGSEFAARDVERVVGVPRSRIRVAVEAPAAAFVPSDDPEAIRAVGRRIGLPEGARWIVYVGGFSPHKNLDVLVRAFARASGREEPSAYLVLVGKLAGDAFHVSVEAVRSAIREAGVEDRVLMPGFVPDEELRHLYSGARALALPSDCEGFGLPAVEAAACGTPVIATTESPLPELLRGGGVFVEPRDEDGLAAALRTMIADEPARCAMARVARERARELSWDRSAREALAALREAARRDS